MHLILGWTNFQTNYNIVFKILFKYIQKNIYVIILKQYSINMERLFMQNISFKNKQTTISTLYISTGNTRNKLT